MASFTEEESWLVAWEGKDTVFAALTIAGLAATIVIPVWLHVRERKATTLPRDAARLQAAMRLSAAAYKLRDEMAYCRAPLISAAEHGTQMDTWEHRAQAYVEVFQGRWKPVGGALSELENASREAEALFGPDAKTRVGALRQCARELHVAIEAYIANEVSRGEDFKSDRDYGKRTRATVFASRDDENNELNQAIGRALADIDALLAPHLR